jgi:hypothetical protein
MTLLQNSQWQARVVVTEGAVEWYWKIGGVAACFNVAPDGLHDGIKKIVPQASAGCIVAAVLERIS